MSRWFRFYDDAVNDPKIIKISDDIFRAWVNLLCVASKHDGCLPAIDDIAIILRVKVARAAAIIAELVSFGLLDKTEDGFAPHNWNGRQYKSDVSTDRVKRFRNGKRNVSETPPETDNRTEQKDLHPVAKATRSDEKFEEFWQDYPKREGANPKEPAAKLFASIVKSGEDPENIIRGVRACKAAESKNIGTPFIPQAVKWLRDKRWLDYQRVEVAAQTDWRAILDSHRRFKHWPKGHGNEPGMPGCRAPPELLREFGFETGGLQ